MSQFVTPIRPSVMDRQLQRAQAISGLDVLKSVSRFLLGVAPKAPPTAQYEVREINGWPAFVGYD
jgi:hypothetical protein